MRKIKTETKAEKRAREQNEKNQQRAKKTTEQIIASRKYQRLQDHMAYDDYHREMDRQRKRQFLKSSQKKMRKSLPIMSFGEFLKQQERFGEMKKKGQLNLPEVPPMPIR